MKLLSKSMLALLAVLLQGHAINALAGELFTPNCLGACPVGASSSNIVIVREDYTLSSNSFTKFADWVAYKVTKDTIGSGCSRPWKADPFLTDAQTLRPSDYKGAHAQLKTDRGHQAPLASFCNTKTWRETDYLSNITPQKSALNQGPWKRLEDKVRELAKSGKAVYVITGPLYEHAMPELPHAHEFAVVPSGYWKVVSFQQNKRVYTSAFVFDQDTPRHDAICEHLTSLPELQKRNHLVLSSNIHHVLSLDSARICH